MRISRMKGSLRYKQAIDTYVDRVVESLIPEKDLKLSKYVICSHEEIAHWLIVDYKYLPVYQRLEKIRQLLTKEIKRRSKEILKEAASFYEDRIERALTQIRDPEKRRETVVRLMDKKEKTLKRIEQDSKVRVKQYMAQFEKQDVFAHYRAFVNQPDHLASFFDSKEDVDLLCKETGGYLDRKRLEIEDTAALLQLKHRLFGFPKQQSIKHVVIDEAQDFSPFQIAALSEALHNPLFTILGDVAQGIHSYRGTNDWKEILEALPAPEAQILTLKKSYRTTVEIMNAANQVIRQLDQAGITEAEPVVRHGDIPRLYEFEKKQDLIQPLLEEIRVGKNKGYQSIAIIGRSLRECKSIHQLLTKETHLKVQLFNGNDSFEDADLLIVPSYIAKGLEF
ncbi:UvrD-helicase domain-containing protein [Paludifilum halophilum]|uniref:DNA 3'-5' helicase n=1 Tax=Paludifilum halophilum TaxID=1642702 RepID=A0A235B9C4_9BACL|nr:UvrD-helicase domain-containing protein [Paludifilum halophilum]OYD08487.1 hypothetical protein CHM34_06570 [Paludifilum halophilum]